jgi:hypothetical protein
MKPVDLQKERVRIAFDRFAGDVRLAERSMHEASELLIKAADTFVTAIIREPIAASDGEPDRLLTRADAAKHLSVDPSTLDEYVRRGLVPVRRLPPATGDREIIRFSVRDLDTWLVSRSVPVRAEAC